MQPLDGCRAKLARVDCHLRELEGLLDAFRSNTHRLVHDYDADAKEIVFKVIDCECVPIELAVVVGDTAHGLRSSLDHLMWRLIEANGNIPKKPEFPIYFDPALFKRDALGKAKGIAPDALKVLEGLQPYQAPYAGDPKKHPLWLLHEINIVDKHRLPLLANLAHFVLQASTTVTLRQPGFGTAGSGIMARAAYAPQEGEELMRVPWSSPDPDAEPESNSKFTFDICFGKEAGDAAMWYVVGTLKLIRTYFDEHIFVKPGLLDFIQ